MTDLISSANATTASPVPLPDFQRTELVMSVSDSFDLMSREGGVLLGELTDLTQYPFRNDTWFGHGHTVAASKAFRETFGYDAWLLLDFQEEAPPLDNGEEIHFLQESIFMGMSGPGLWKMTACCILRFCTMYLVRGRCW